VKTGKDGTNPICFYQSGSWEPEITLPRLVKKWGQSRLSPFFPHFSLPRLVKKWGQSRLSPFFRENGERRDEPHLFLPIWELEPEITLPRLVKKWGQSRLSPFFPPFFPFFTVESAHDYTFKYLTVSRNVTDEYARRVISFINRHDAAWKGKFDSEDAAGKR